MIFSHRYYQFLCICIFSLCCLSAKSIRASGQSDGSDVVQNAQLAFSDNFDDENATGWLPLTESAWSVKHIAGSNYAYYLDRTKYGNGEYSLIQNYLFADFTMTAKIKSDEDLNANEFADIVVIFGYLDKFNCYWLNLSSGAGENKLYRIINGTTSVIASYNGVTIKDNEFKQVQVKRQGQNLKIWYDNTQIINVNDNTFPTGRIGLGSYNDAAFFDNVNITGDVTLSGSLELISPAAGDMWEANIGGNITWDRKFIWGTVKLEFSRNGGKNWSTIVPSATNDGSVFWTPEAQHISDNCYIRVVSLENDAVRDVNNEPFKIVMGETDFVYHAQKLMPGTPVPKIDGIFDEALWEMVAGDTLLYGGVPYDWDAVWTDLADNTVIWKAVWKEQTNKLYVAVKIIDDIHGPVDNSNPTLSLFRPWEDESIEFFTDGNHDGGSFEDDNIKAQQWRVSVDNIRTVYGFGSSIYDEDDFITAVSTGDDGNWICEAVFNVYDSFPDQQRDLSDGDVIGWNIWYNDQDNDTYHDGVYWRDHQTGWRYTGPAYETADHFGEMVLTDSPVHHIEVTAPNGGEIIYVGDPSTITWDTESQASKVKILFTSDNGVTWWNLGEFDNTGVAEWTPEIQHVGNQCLIQVSIPAVSEHLNDRSDATFQVVAQAGLPDYWAFVENTGHKVSVVLPKSIQPNIKGEALKIDDYIGIFTQAGICCGWAQWKGENLLLIAWGDNDQTPELEGLVGGEVLAYRIYRVSEHMEWDNVEVAYSAGTGKYSPNSYMVLSMFEVPDIVCQNIMLDKGWNLFSTRIVADDMDAELLMKPIVDDVIILQDAFYGAYVPEYNINTLGALDVLQGYYIYMKDDVQLNICGQEIDQTTPVPLLKGWNMISYLPSYKMSAPTAFSSVKEKLIIVKDGAGNAYIPDYNINNIGKVYPGKGYQAYMSDDATLVYPVLSLAKSMLQPEHADQVAVSEHFNVSYRSRTNCIVVIPVANQSILEIGDEIAAFNADGLCCGTAVWQGQNLALTIWGDDSQTQAVDGMQIGQPMHFRVWQRASNQEFNAAVEFMDGAVSVFVDNALLIASNVATSATSVVKDLTTPASFRILNSYPNPFNPETNIVLELPETAQVDVRVFDIQGRLVSTLFHGQKDAGVHRIQWNATSQPSGLYMTVIQAGSEKRTLKLMLMK
ncbi:T9SS type A sorting domain-containing protein [candidate division KSB1 bacterium]|nr:T9SS type A sorting domain-containing protein [candidate division KSB1 bacterium]